MSYIHCHLDAIEEMERSEWGRIKAGIKRNVFKYVLHADSQLDSQAVSDNRCYVREWTSSEMVD